MALPENDAGLPCPPQYLGDQIVRTRRYRSLDPVEAWQDIQELSCSLQNRIPSRLQADGIDLNDWPDISWDPDIHPLFSRRIFQQAIGCPHDPDVLPFSTGAYERIRPALQFASRALVDRRYIAFWASLANCANIPISGPWNVRLFTDTELTPSMITHTHVRLLQLSSRLCCIGHSGDPTRTDRIAQEVHYTDAEKGDLTIHITFTDRHFEPFVTSQAWNLITDIQRTAHMSKFSSTLLHEVAHAFVAFVFYIAHGIRLDREPVIERLAPKRNLKTMDGEVGRAWDNFFQSDGPSFLSILNPSNLSASHSYKDAMRMSIHLAKSDTWITGTSYPLYDSSRPAFHISVPLPWIEARFQETWFQRPYPRWSLRKAPTLHCKIFFDDHLQVTEEALECFHQALGAIMPAKAVSSYWNQLMGLRQANSRHVRAHLALWKVSKQIDGGSPSKYGPVTDRTSRLKPRNTRVTTPPKIQLPKPRNTRVTIPPEIQPPKLPEMKDTTVPSIHTPTFPWIRIPTIPWIRSPTIPWIRSPIIPWIRSPVVPWIPSPKLPSTEVTACPKSQTPKPRETKYPYTLEDWREHAKKYGGTRLQFHGRMGPNSVPMIEGVGSDGEVVVRDELPEKYRVRH